MIFAQCRLPKHLAFGRTKRTIHLHKPPTLPSYVNQPFRFYIWIHQHSERRLINDIRYMEMLVDASNLIPDTQQLASRRC